MLCGIFRKTYSKIVIRILFILIILIIFVAYWLVLHPLISWMFFPPKEYSGTEIYTSGKYLKFEDGYSFKDAVDSLDFVDECTITGFYYYDTWARDIPLYRKMCDTYCLDLQADNNYDKIKTQVLLLSKQCAYLGKYDLHLISDPTTSTEHIIIAMNDHTSEIRCLMITERVPSNHDFAGTLTMHTGLAWD